MHPILVRIGSFPIGTYGLVLLVAYFVSVGIVARRMAHTEGLDRDEVVWHFVLAMFVALASAKLLAILTVLPVFLQNPARLTGMLFSGGVLYGGFLGALVFAAWLGLVKKVRLLKYLDIAAPATAVGVAIGRWGCFLSGCCFGRPTRLPWGVHFASADAHLLHPNLPDRTPSGEPIYLHPTQIYDSINMAIIAVILFAWYRRKKADGEVACLGLILYGIGRSVVEMFRGDAVRGTVFGVLSTSQFIGLSLAAGAAVLWMILRTRARRGGLPPPFAREDLRTRPKPRKASSRRRAAA